MFISKHVIKNWLEAKEITPIAIEYFTNIDILLKDKMNFFKLLNFKSDYEINLFDIHQEMLYHT